MNAEGTSCPLFYAPPVGIFGKSVLKTSSTEKIRENLSQIKSQKIWYKRVFLKPSFSMYILIGVLPVNVKTFLIRFVACFSRVCKRNYI